MMCGDIINTWNVINAELNLSNVTSTKDFVVTPVEKKRSEKRNAGTNKLKKEEMRSVDGLKVTEDGLTKNDTDKHHERNKKPLSVSAGMNKQNRAHREKKKLTKFISDVHKVPYGSGGANKRQKDVQCVGQKKTYQLTTLLQSQMVVIF